MLKYLVKRVLWMIPLLIGISLISFFIMHLAPGDITSNESAFNPKASEESRQKLREMYNLDKPVIVQYGLWLQRMATLDFGKSFASHQKPVFWQTADKDGNITKGLIQEALPITLMINILGLAITLLLAIPLGIIAARKHLGWQDRSITLFNFIGFSIPGFWLSLLLMYWLGVVNQWFPISGLHSLNYESLDTWGKSRIHSVIYFYQSSFLLLLALLALPYLLKTACSMYCIRTTSQRHAPKAWQKAKWFTSMHCATRCYP